MPINISAGSPQITASGGSRGNAESSDGHDGIFSDLLDLLGGGTNTDQTDLQQSGNTFFNFQLGNLSVGLNTADLPKSLPDIADLLGIGGDNDANEDIDPDQALAGLAGPLVELLNSLAAKLDAFGDVPIDKAEAALRLARGLIQQIGGSPDADIDLALQAGARDPTQQSLASQLRAAAADLDLVRHNIPIPTARADATAIFNGTAPTLDDLLNPKQHDGSGARSDVQTDTTRLANALGASLTAKADATANQPAPTANGAQTLAAALAEAGLKADLNGQGQSKTDALPNAQITATGAPTLSSDVSAAARPMQAAYQPPQINLQQLAFNIASQFKAGNSRFQIRMDPPELGRIDVRMNVDPHGAIHARLAVDRPETLDMLRNDSRALERALQQAGLDQSKTNLEFSLRQNGSGGEHGGGNGQPAQGDNPQSLPVDETIPPSSTLSAYRGTASPGGLNLWV